MSQQMPGPAPTTSVAEALSRVNDLLGEGLDAGTIRGPLVDELLPLLATVRGQYGELLDGYENGLAKLEEIQGMVEEFKGLKERQVRRLKRKVRRLERGF